VDSRPDSFTSQRSPRKGHAGICVSWYLLDAAQGRRVTENRAFLNLNPISKSQI
jgi:hypothetical protein